MSTDGEARKTAEATTPKKDRPRDVVSATVQNTWLSAAQHGNTPLVFHGPNDLHLEGRILRWDTYALIVQPVGTERAVLLYKHAVMFIEPAPDVQ